MYLSVSFNWGRSGLCTPESLVLTEVCCEVLCLAGGSRSGVGGVSLVVSEALHVDAGSRVFLCPGPR